MKPDGIPNEVIPQHKNWELKKKKELGVAYMDKLESGPAHEGGQCLERD